MYTPHFCKFIYDGFDFLNWHIPTKILLFVRDITVNTSFIATTGKLKLKR